MANAGLDGKGSCICRASTPSGENAEVYPDGGAVGWVDNEVKNS